MRNLLVLGVVVLISVHAQAQGQRPEAKGPATEIVALQVMLDRLGFSPGEIDGRPGRNLSRAVDAFARAHGGPASSSTAQTAAALDPALQTRVAETAGNPPAFIEYTITEQDLAGPFQSEIPNDLMQQAKLPSLAYRNALEALAERFHTSPRLLQSLNPGVTFSRAGERFTTPNVLDGIAPATPSGPVTIIVTKATSSLTVQEEGGRLLFHAPVTTGSRRDPLPVGKWKVTGVQRMPKFHYNPALFWDANPKHSKAVVPAGPNNPVGVVWIDITKEHYGIHGTPEPSRVGHVESHGCVRLTNWDAERVAQWTKPGTAVIFQ